MHHFVFGFCGAVVGVALALFAYDRFVVQPRAAAQALLQQDLRAPASAPPPTTASAAAGNAPAQLVELPPDTAPPTEPEGDLAHAMAEAGDKLAGIVGA